MRPTVLLTLLLFSAAPLRAQARYTVHVNDPATRMFHVVADLPATGESTIVSLPAWTPGHYTIENYARYVSGFSATDVGGRTLDWEKLDPDTWRIASAGADRVQVAFDFLADTINLSGSVLLDDFGFLNGTNLFLYPETGLDFSSEVTFELPSGWKIATGLTRTAPNRYSASDYDELVDAPTFLGSFGIDSLEVDGVPIRLAVYPPAEIGTEWGRLSLEALGKIADYLHELWGEAPPYDAYTMLIYLEDDPLPFGGGLEHANSHLDILPLQIANPQVFPGLFSLYSHEYVHAWNVKRIRPAEMWPYDYAEMQPTPLLWVSEGITDYYGDLVLARTGIWSPSELWESFAQAGQTVALEPPYAVEDSSVETWIDAVEVSSQFYYAKGKLLGLLLDTMIRDATDGAASLDDVMVRLYRERYRAGSGFTTDDVLDFVDDHVDPAAVRSFYERYVDGRDPLPFADILPAVGLTYRQETTAQPYLGVGAEPGEAGELVVSDVTPGSAAGGPATGRRAGVGGRGSGVDRRRLGRRLPRTVRGRPGTAAADRRPPRRRGADAPDHRPDPRADRRHDRGGPGRGRARAETPDGSPCAVDTSPGSWSSRWPVAAPRPRPARLPRTRRLPAAPRSWRSDRTSTSSTSSRPPPRWATR
jgi:predicted metalloprotease with PDZ domain